MTTELAPDVRQRFDQHLDAVEQTLIAAGRSREQRRAVVDDLETQILDMLAKRSSTPALTDIEAVLAGLDPPGAYADVPVPAPVATPVPAIPRPRYSRTALAGFICILVSLIPASLVFAVTLYMTRAMVPPPAPALAVPTDQFRRDPESGEMRQEVIHMAPEGRATPQRARWANLLCMLTVVGPLGLAGTILGWIAFSQIRNSGGMIQGRGLALFDGLFYPIAVPLFLLLIIA